MGVLWTGPDEMSASDKASTMKVLSAAELPEGAFIIVEDEEGKAFIYFETQHGYHVFSTEEDWSNVLKVHTFVQAMFQQGAARMNSPTNGGAVGDRAAGTVTEVIDIER
jgi:hypothetical protein